MSRYRKKPVVVDAIQYTGDNLREVLEFTGKHPRWSEWFDSFEAYQAHVERDGRLFKIFTLEGVMEATPGDWIIRGVQGEYYPCKPDIFAATYSAETPTPAPNAVTLPEGVETAIEAHADASEDVGRCSHGYEHYDDVVPYRRATEKQEQTHLALRAEIAAALEKERDPYRDMWEASEELSEERRRVGAEYRDRAEAAEARVRELEAVVEAARLMPRQTPAAGGAFTVHTFEIEAGVVWQLDRALNSLDAARQAGEVEG